MEVKPPDEKEPEAVEVVKAALQGEVESEQLKD